MQNRQPFKRSSGPLFTGLLLLFFATFLSAQDKEAPDIPPREPELTSMFPLAGKSGATVEATVRGRTLKGAYAVWFESGDVNGRIVQVEEIDLDQTKKEETEKEADQESKSPRRGHRVSLQLQVKPEARIGAHRLRLVSPRGISNALTFWVHSDPVIAERAHPHQTSRNAQVISPPIVVNGRIDTGGEPDYYGFEARRGQEMVFETGGTATEPVLYKVTGSWFDPNRASRVIFDVDSRPRLTFRFVEEGRYLLKVGGDGGLDSSYRLRIAPVEEKTPSRLAGIQWRERGFSRKIESDWLEQLRSRAISRPADGTSGREDNGGKEDLSTTPSIVKEQEPNETRGQALEVSIPTVIEGAVDRPGEIDTFRFKLAREQALAFEIETPDVVPERFSPRLAVLDAKGREVLTNIYKWIPSQGNNYYKAVRSKTLYTFSDGGDYYLQIRDLTFRNGDPRFRYRLLIRPQIPHVGEIEVAETVHLLEREGVEEKDRINLLPGSVEKFTVVTSQEEGFLGDIMVAVENLPPGVKLVPGTQLEPEGGVGREKDPGRKERFVPRTERVMMMLVAERDAPPTRMPYLLRVNVRPVVWVFEKEGAFGMIDYFREGRMGSSLLAQEIPIMMVSREASAQGGAP